MAGVPLVHFSGLKPGTEVKIRTAEIKYPDLPAYQDHVGMIMAENLRVATSQDVYVAREVKRLSRLDIPFMDSDILRLRVLMLR